jgi:hypothetical protein
MWGNVLVVCEVKTPDGQRAAMREMVAEELWDDSPEVREYVRGNVRAKLTDFVGFPVDEPVQVLRQIRRGNDWEWVKS